MVSSSERWLLGSSAADTAVAVIRTAISAMLSPPWFNILLFIGITLYVI
jgi:hypothetical protein